MKANPMADDLGQIQRTLGELQRDMGKVLQSSENARSQRNTIFDTLKHQGEELIRLRQEHNVLSRDVEKSIKPEIETFKKVRNRGVGIIAGLVLATGSVSAWLTRTFSNIWPHQ